MLPRRAKSAATLLALGADRILLSEHGELGPLDVKIFEADREDYISALDEVQAIERLSAFSLEVVDGTMMLLRGGKAMSAAVKKLKNMSTYNAVETAIERAKSSPRETWENIVKRSPLGKSPKAESDPKKKESAS